MKRGPPGFTVVELVFAILIGGILTSIAIATFNGAYGGYVVRGARDSFVAMHARARAQAIELGENVILDIHSAGDSVSIRTEGGDLLESLRFDEQRQVELLPAGTSLQLCLSPRGYADESCTSFTSPKRLEFWHNADSVGVGILPLGQLVY